jgi:hypothetical protein
MDDKLEMTYETEHPRQQTRVKTISGDQFESEVLKNPDHSQFLLEVFKHDCPGCAVSGKVFNALSHKLHKHGFDVPQYRTHADNKIPFLGNFGYTPMYFYVKKNAQNQITEIQTLDSLMANKGQTFMNTVSELFEMPQLTDKVKIVPNKQFMFYITMKDLDPAFEIDHDLLDDDQ